MDLRNMAVLVVAAALPKPLLLLLCWWLASTGLELALLVVFDGGPKSLGEMLIERTSRFLALPGNTKFEQST